MKNKKLLLLVMLSILLTACAQIDTIPASSEVKQLLHELEQNPNNAFAHMKLGDYYFVRADQLNSLDMIRKAVNYYDKSLALAPKHLGTQIALYLANYRLSIFSDPDAAARVRHLFNNIPEHARAKLNPPSLSFFFADIIRASEGHKTPNSQLRYYLLDAIKEQPKSVIAYQHLGRHYAHANQQDLAIATLKQSLRHNSEDPTTLKELGLIHSTLANNMECVYEDLHDTRQAAKYLSRALKYLPEDTDIHENLYLAYSTLNLTPMGVNHARRLNELKENHENRLTLGDALNADMQLTQARQVYQALIDERFYDAYLQLAYLYSSVGDWDNEVHYLDRYLHTQKDKYFYVYLMKSIAIEAMNLSTYSRQDFLTDTSALELQAWEKSISDYWLGQLSEQDFLSRSKDICQQTEADFYIGFNYFEKKQSEKARFHFERVLELNAFGFVEYSMAKVFLAKLPDSTAP